MFLLLAFAGLELAQAHNLANGLGIEAGGLGLGQDLSYIGIQSGAIFFQPLDALYEAAQSVHSDATRIGHWPSLPKFLIFTAETAMLDFAPGD
jgi:hypothetical protein